MTFKGMFCRFTMACCLKSIYQERKKVKAWIVTVQSIIVKGHQSSLIV